MTILPAMQSAALRLIGRKPSTVFAATSQFEQEIADLANEVAQDIVKTHDWQALTKIHSFAGDGLAVAFDRPADYDRMVVASEIGDSQNSPWGYTHIVNVNEWLRITNGEVAGVFPGAWTLLAGQFQFYPAPTGPAAMPYVSNQYARSQSGSPQASFQRDDDEFLLDARLLTLGLIWRWREMKHLDTTGDQAAFEKAFSEAVARDKGARVIRLGGSVSPRGSVAWPWVLG